MAMYKGRPKKLTESKTTPYTITLLDLYVAQILRKNVICECRKMCQYIKAFTTFCLKLGSAGTTFCLKLRSNVNYFIIPYLELCEK